MNDIAINYIRKYACENFEECSIYVDINKFKNHSYSRWIIDELIIMIMDNPLISATTTIDNFILNMMYLSVNRDSYDDSTILKIGISVAEKLLVYLCDLEEGGYI